MKNVTLISDWKLRDPYVAIFKGQLVSQIEDIQIFDITHSVELHNTLQTVFILKSSYKAFPKGTVHIILTGLPYASNATPVWVEYDGHFFVGEDNGIFSLILEQEDLGSGWQYPNSTPDSDIFKKMVNLTAWHFEGTLKEKCEAGIQLTRKISQKADYSDVDNKLTGQIAYIDSTCNAITDIPVDLFLKSRSNRKFSATFNSGKSIKVSCFHEQYNRREEDIYFVGNRLGYLELTISFGNIAALANLRVGDKVSIVFEE